MLSKQEGFLKDLIRVIGSQELILNLGSSIRTSLMEIRRNWKRLVKPVFGNTPPVKRIKHSQVSITGRQVIQSRDQDGTDSWS
ncbi:hypothetical protein P8452_56021 [Trifolium repens]|nr:hypothetical protein P8452_56021 [Trifolium repens]